MYLERKEDIEEDAERIVIAAAEIIRAEIRERKYDSKSYPTNEDIADVDTEKESMIQSHTPPMKILLMLIQRKKV